MFSFDYYNPTKILFGQDKLQEVSKLIPTTANVLITYGGGSVRRNGILDKVKACLKNDTVIEFGGIEPNPRYETLVRAIEIVRNQNIDFVLAVGGGSVIDGSKFICLASHYRGNATDLLKYGFTPITSKTVNSVIPLGVVLTLAATGSEMNNGASIKYENGKFTVMSDMMFPKFSILDPTFTYTLPKIQVANGIIDAFIHVAEQYITFPVDAMVQDRMAEGIMQTLIEIGTTSVNEPENYNIRANHVWSATMALNGLIGSGVPQDWAAHMIGLELTALYNIDHAQTLACVYPALLEICREQKHDKLIQYGKRVWGIQKCDEEEVIDIALQKTRDFFESLGIKTSLSDYGVTVDNIPTIIEQLKVHGFTALSENGSITLEVSAKILEKALS